MPSSPSTTERVVHVAVPVPGLGVLSYRVPDQMSIPPKGARVRVPLGSRAVVGCVVPASAAAGTEGPLKDVVEAIDTEPFLPSTVVDLALWVGEYYASGPGDALSVAMPPAARQGARDAFRSTERARVTAAGGEAGAAVRGVRQREALDALRAAPGGLTMPEMQQRGVGRASVARLVRLGLVELSEEVVERDPFAAGGGDARWSIDHPAHDDRGLTDEQREAFRTLTAAVDARQFRTLLLHGVTGSGKTELYLRLAADVAAAGRKVLILVPEIALTPNMAGQFRSRFGSRVAIQHSGLSAGERHDQWHRIRRGDIDVVVGTRSAVFAPLVDVGVIVVDEEHEGSYKQDESPRYHGRDVAVVRARMEGAVAVLGSATPSLESAANAAAGRYEILRLTRRVAGRPLAAVRIVDMRQEYADLGPAVTISRPLAAAIGARLERGEQSLVLLNRRGFATVIFCRQCGASLECPHCSVTLTFHRAARRMRCHYCNHNTAVPRRCGGCGGEFLEQSGVGTERVEADLVAAFPDARITRVDRDTVRRKGAIARVLRDVSAGAIDILVGTQMIAKGHDFPAVTLVGVISADVGLGLADFRASERTFQLLTQVVGRAGRGDVPGEAIVQTLYPEHYSIKAAAAQDYDAFFEQEMTFRRALHYPPAVALINVVIKGRTLDAAMADAADLVKRIREAGPGTRVIGPAPAALSKIKDEYRAQFFLKGTGRRSMRAALVAALDARPDLRRKVTVDVDPMSVL